MKTRPVRALWCPSPPDTRRFGFKGRKEGRELGGRGARRGVEGGSNQTSLWFQPLWNRFGEALLPFFFFRDRPSVDGSSGLPLHQIAHHLAFRVVLCCGVCRWGVFKIFVGVSTIWVIPRTPPPRTTPRRTAQNFALFFPLPSPFRSFFLSGGLLVEFWLC